MKLFCIIGLFSVYQIQVLDMLIQERVAAERMGTMFRMDQRAAGRVEAERRRVGQDGPEGCWEGGGREEMGRRRQETHLVFNYASCSLSCKHIDSMLAF